MQVVHNAYTPKETTELCSRAGTMKGNMRADKVFMSSFVAGCLLAFACACTVGSNSAMPTAKSMALTVVLYPMNSF
jgi:formate/nitrite transporter FocA (FNT family)